LCFDPLKRHKYHGLEIGLLETGIKKLEHNLKFVLGSIADPGRSKMPTQKFKKIKSFVFGGVADRVRSTKKKKKIM
jgi:hypothetical protein